jgi:hypothetical protein
MRECLDNWGLVHGFACGQSRPIGEFHATLVSFTEDIVSRVMFLRYLYFMSLLFFVLLGCILGAILTQQIEAMPRSAIKAYLNPWGHDMDHERLLQYADNIRQEPIEVPLLGPVSGVNRVPFEMARLGWSIAEMSGIVNHLGVSQRLVDDSRDAANEMSRRVVEHQHKRVRLFQQDHPDVIYEANRTITGLFLVAANLAAEEGHSGQFRDSIPRFPYVWHPRAMQALRALVSANVEAPDDVEERHREQALCAVHDVLEMGLETAGFHSLVDRQIVTPQDSGSLAIALDVDPESCREFVGDYRSITKFPGPRPSGRTSLELNMYYMSQLTPRAKVAKSADAHDNLHNPKPGQSQAALSKYKWALENLPLQLEQDGEAARARIARMVGMLDPQLVREFFVGPRDTYHDVLALL